MCVVVLSAATLSPTNSALAQSNVQPSFDSVGYVFHMPSGTDGSSGVHTVGIATASDSDADATLTYSLRASDPINRMYMIGQTDNALYTLDGTTGVAVRIGNATGFDAGITTVQGLAWHNGKLYLAAATSTDNDGIFTVDTTTGIAVHVTRLQDLGVAAAPLTGLSSHNGYLYLTAAGGSGKLFKVDLNANIATQLGGDDFGDVNETNPTGVASHDGKLYMIGAGTDKLYEIDMGESTQEYPDCFEHLSDLIAFRHARSVLNVNSRIAFPRHPVHAMTRTLLPRLTEICVADFHQIGEAHMTSVVARRLQQFLHTHRIHDTMQAANSSGGCESRPWRLWWCGRPTDGAAVVV